MIKQELVKLAPRGQIVIPKRFRDDLQLEIGCRLMVCEVDGKLIVEKARINEAALYEDRKQKRLDQQLRDEGELFV
jgi:AbrB family looped-hinge helix DNA binding protein